jgi:hypothetical protein
MPTAPPNIWFVGACKEDLISPDGNASVQKIDVNREDKVVEAAGTVDVRRGSILLKESRIEELQESRNCRTMVSLSRCKALQDRYARLRSLFR